MNLWAGSKDTYDRATAHIPWIRHDYCATNLVTIHPLVERVHTYLSLLSTRQ